MSKQTADYDAIVIGAGFSGVRSLWELTRLGLTVKCFDAASDVGGTWYWNRYPGSRTDGEAWIYAFNFAPELLDKWDYHERYPSQEEIQRYISRVVDSYDLRKHIEFETRVSSAHYSDSENIWTIKTAKGLSTTCRYFVPATGILSVPKSPRFTGLQSYTGEWYQAANWPAHKIDFHGKRVAIVGTGSTGVHLIPKLAPIAKKLSVFQRTANYVLPGRNHTIDEYQVVDIKKNHGALWELATMNLGGHACKSSGKTVKGSTDDEVRRGFDNGWERGCFNFQMETFDDIFMDPESNEKAAEYVREKIRAIVQDPKKAELLCPNYPFGSKRSPSGHFYYEAFNRPNVELIDISEDEIELYEKGIRTKSGSEHEVEMIIFALGFDSGVGAMNEIDIKGSQGKSLKELWKEKLDTFAGILVSGFPNMFIVCGPHMPLGNQPTILEVGMKWIGSTIEHMEKNKFARIDVPEKAMTAWSSHVGEIWDSVFISKHAVEKRSWFVTEEVPGEPTQVMFYFGGVQSWKAWLDKEITSEWESIGFQSPADTKETGKDHLSNGSITAEILESIVVPLQSDEIGMSAAEKFNLTSAACARYISWAVEDIHKRKLAVRQDHRAHWWRALETFVQSDSGQKLIQQSPKTKDELERVTAKLGVEGEAIAWIGPEIVPILTGKTNPLFHILKNDLLFRMYLADEGARPNRYVAQYAKSLSSHKKDMRILEVGAGTGGTTFQVLQACSPGGEPFCAEYMYTDVSNFFFKTGQTTLKKWENLLTFKTLNVENDPAKQGFEEHSYDLIIAANVVHATRSLSGSLRTIHKLLKPGGTLGLVELTRLTPYFNLSFGSLSGWWLGVDEGRTGSPLQTTEQWNEQLQKSGFSGVDLVAYDLPEPERHSALLLSTALATDSTTNGTA